MDSFPNLDPIWAESRWRVGDNSALIIYAIQPNKGDQVIAMVLTPFMARYIVDLHNRTITP